MHLGDLVPPPYARATTCEAPCAWCGSDGAAGLVSGAALSRDVALGPDDTLSRVGMWLSLPDRVRALRVYVTGSALRDGLVAPTAVRMHTADVSAESAPSWQGAPLTGATVHGERSLVAELRAPAGDGGALSRVGVVEVAGLTRGAGEGTLSLRAVVDAGGCLTQSIALRVEPLRAPERAVEGAYVAFTADPASQAARVARWVDRVAGALATSGVLRGVVSVRAGAAIEGVAAVSPRGVDGPVWRSALRRMASGRAAWVELWDPCDPERAGVSVALGTRARPSPCEMSAWAATEVDLCDAWWSASEHEREGTLQALTGRWLDPVTPRVLTAWERARGLRTFSAEGRWLTRFVRAPGQRAGIRGAVYEGDAVRACWPGAASIEARPR